MGWRFCLAVKAWLCVGAASAVLAAPRIVCDEPVYVFGDATTQPAIAHEFVLRNGGDADLRFGKVKTCCGVEAALAAGRLAPGSNAVLAVKLSLAGRRGPVNKSIYVASNDPRQRSTVKARALPVLSFR